MSPSSVKLYVALYYFAQKHSAVRLEFSNAQLQSHAGMDAKSIRSACRQLCDRRLITAQKGALGVYTYTLLNPTSGEPLPSPEGRTGLRRYHSPLQGPPDRRSEERMVISLEPPFPTSAIDGSAAGQDEQFAFRCFSCKGGEYWARGADRVCVRCHPNPRSPVVQRKTQSPTAAEMGF